MRWSVVAMLLTFAACGGAGPHMPDYTEWIRAGVDPRLEADAIVAGLARAGFHETRRIETEAWIAIEARTADDRRAIRVVTRIGAALVLDSHEDAGLMMRHGQIELVDPPLAQGHDLDGDAHDEILVGAEADDRLCLLPFRVAGDGTIAPVAPDLGALASEACVERLEDIDGDQRLDGIAVLRVRDLAPDLEARVEIPVMLDAHARMSATALPIAWSEREREARAVALERARTIHDARAVLRLAVELATIARIEGGSTQRQLAAFDRAIAGTVWPADLAEDAVSARARLR